MKNAIVTGASGNLGQAVIRKFISEGFRVIGSLVPNDPATPPSFEGNYEGMHADLMNEESATQFIRQVIDKYQTIDAAVLTVGGFAMGKIENTSSSDILKQCRLNFETAYNCARPIFLQMMKQGMGRIFLIGSRPGADMHQSKGMIAYGFAKSLIFRLAEVMNDEAKGKNIVTSVVVPSTIDTPQNRTSMPDADPSKWVKPESIADIILFYCSDKALVLREPVIKVYNNA